VGNLDLRRAFPPLILNEHARTTIGLEQRSRMPTPFRRNGTMKRTAIILGVIGLVCAASFAYIGLQAATRIAMSEGRARVAATLSLTLQALDGHLRRFETIPDLLADNDAVRAVLDAPGDPMSKMALNRWLAQKSLQLDALDIYVMTPDGVTIAASNHDRPASFIGQNFSYRPYFQTALAGKKGRFYAVGTTSGVRGYYFAAPVRNRVGGVAGVIAVKIGLDAIEAEWRLQESQIIVTDPEGIIFLSSDPSWLYKALLPLTADRLDRTIQSRRYADLLPTEIENSRSTVGRVATIYLPDAEGNRRQYVIDGAVLPRVDWKVQVLQDSRPMHAQARLAVLAGMLFLGSLIAVFAGMLQRRMRLAERFALQEQAKAELEHRVEKRTADLARVNRLIEAEITERRNAEAELRRTQSDLVQAGKLAALGQMSAALSHEINQPLAAARNYADSATILIDRGDTARAKDNIGQIMSLIDRMAAIARHLRHVARKPDTQLQDIALSAAVAEALAMIAPRLAGAKVTVALPDDLPLVQGGPVRLQQVLVNLLTNAADAVDGCADPQIEIAASVAAGRVQLSVHDNGPGVAPAIADRIFDPFFTTKGVGSGLGLGLSITYNIMKDFGGDLRVTNAADGGAVFTADFTIAPTKAEGPQT
jgi:two-component system, NtrC family, C4-dicarboxylate transport sensor histidine kinase DctB